MVSERLHQLKWYQGQTVQGQDMSDNDTAWSNREARTRASLGTTYLRRSPDRSVIDIGGGVPGIQLNNISGFVNNKDMYLTSPVQKTLATATHGVTGSTVVAGSGNEKWLVVAVAYTNTDYDNRLDIDGAPVTARRDDTILIRIYAGTEAALGTDDIPTVDTDCIPLMNLRRTFEDTVGTIFVQYRDEFVLMRSALIEITDFRDLIQLSDDVGILIEQNSRSTVPILEVSDQVSSGGIVTLKGDYLGYLDGRVRRLSEVTYGISGISWSKSLDVNSRYFVRMKMNTYGYLEPYVQKGADWPDTSGESYSYPVGLVGQTGGSSGGGFPSTRKDILLGMIVTGGTGTTPVLTTFDTRCSWYYEAKINGDYSNNPIYDVDIVLPVPASSRDYDIEIRPSEESFTAVGPTVNHVHGHQEYFKVKYYNFTQISVEAKGKWLMKDVSDFLKMPSSIPYYRPGFVIKVRTRTKGV